MEIYWFYGHLEPHTRKESWNLLTYLNAQYSLPWLCCGDFNEILSVSKKSNGAQRSQRQMEGFHDVMSACGFQDLGISMKFMWCNMQEGSNRVYLRLDRAFANSKCFNIFKDARVYHLAKSTSNHCLLRITNSCSLPPTRKCRLHFEAMWAKREDYQEITEATWNGGNSLNTPEGIASNLSHCASELTAWNKSVIDNIPRKIQEKWKALNNLTAQVHVGSHRVAIDEIRKEINDLLDSEEILWHWHKKIH